MGDAVDQETLILYIGCGSAAGAVVLGIVIGVIIWCCRRKKRRRERKAANRADDPEIQLDQIFEAAEGPSSQNETHGRLGNCSVSHAAQEPVDLCSVIVVNPSVNRDAETGSVKDNNPLGQHTNEISAGPDSGRINYGYDVDGDQEENRDIHDSSGLTSESDNTLEDQPCQLTADTDSIKSRTNVQFNSSSVSYQGGSQINKDLENEVFCRRAGLAHENTNTCSSEITPSRYGDNYGDSDDGNDEDDDNDDDDDYYYYNYNSSDDDDDDYDDDDDDDEEEEEEEEEEDSDDDDDDDEYRYTVDNRFLKKHVVFTWEMPRNKRSLFAFKKVKKNYTHPYWPKIFTIILVDDKNVFCGAIKDEAERKATGPRRPFTTDNDFNVVNFKLVSGDHYNYDREGDACLQLSCEPRNVINHLYGVIF